MKRCIYYIYFEVIFDVMKTAKTFSPDINFWLTPYKNMGCFVHYTTVLVYMAIDVLHTYCDVNNISLDQIGKSVDQMSTFEGRH